MGGTPVWLVVVALLLSQSPSSLSELHRVFNTPFLYVVDVSLACVVVNAIKHVDGGVVKKIHKLVPDHHWKIQHRVGKTGSSPWHQKSNNMI